MADNSVSAAASGHPAVTEAAATILEAGGNAFDGIIAAGFASTVAEPNLASLGGGGFLLAHGPAIDPVLFDFFVDTPGRNARQKPDNVNFSAVDILFPGGARQTMYAGEGSVAVPGMLKGLLHVHAKLGQLPLATVLEPAVELAKKGLILNQTQAGVIEQLYPIMTLTPDCKQLFINVENRRLQVGELFRNPALGDYLEKLPNLGDQDFYSGDCARRMIADMEQQGGLLTLDDLKNYQVIERKPACYPYRHIQFLTNPAPSHGGGLIALALRELQKNTLDTIAGSGDHLLALANAMQVAEQWRRKGILRPEDITPDNSHPLAENGTTHISVCDYTGNVASFTSSNGTGSGYVAPGTGIIMNNMMGEEDLHPGGFHSALPGLRVASMMSPSLVVENDQVKLILGSGGSKRIRSAILQVLCNVVDFNLPLQTAVSAPRIYWDGETLQIEPDFISAPVEQLSKEMPVNLWPKKDLFFGGVHSVIPTGEAAGDPRREGTAIIL